MINYYKLPRMTRKMIYRNLLARLERRELVNFHIKKANLSKNFFFYLSHEIEYIHFYDSTSRLSNKLVHTDFFRILSLEYSDLVLTRQFSEKMFIIIVNKYFEYLYNNVNSISTYTYPHFYDIWKGVIEDNNIVL